MLLLSSGADEFPGKAHLARSRLTAKRLKSCAMRRYDAAHVLDGAMALPAVLIETALMTALDGR
jgi:hypothetical protein